MSEERVIGLKVDVDTFRGMKEGVPTLLNLFKKYGVHASFFVPMGKDHTGRTVKRVFTRAGFVSKAGRTSVLKTYGLKTLLYGLLLPGPEIAARHAGLLRAIVDEGHEAGIHGLDHVYWHDHIRHLDRQQTEAILQKAVAVYREIFGTGPRSFAAPGWVVNAHALSFFQQHGFVYTSDVRGQRPFLPKMGGSTFDLIQIPTTLPTLDEVLGLEGEDEASITRYFLSCLQGGLNILTVHAELEGRHWSGFLASFVQETLAMGFRYERLIDTALRLKQAGPLPVNDVTYGYVRGRAGEVTLQKISNEQ